MNLASSNAPFFREDVFFFFFLVKYLQNSAALVERSRGLKRTALVPDADKRPCYHWKTNLSVAAVILSARLVTGG